MSSDLKKLEAEVISFRDARNWKQFHNPKDLAISLCLEANEVAEHFQWKTNEECLSHVRDDKDAVADELADVLNYLLIMAHDFEIDLGDALEQKIKKNNEKYPVNKSKGNHKKYTEF